MDGNGLEHRGHDIDRLAGQPKRPSEQSEDQ